ncbi:hypothetical protein D7D81_16995 [Halocella sp. SP3-1]|nr:hypothetical protein D7D81_16995 [Halocella sp. SP3-1]
MGLITAICQAQNIEYSKTVICPYCNEKALHISDIAECSNCGAKWTNLIELLELCIEDFKDDNAEYIKLMTER